MEAKEYLKRIKILDTKIRNKKLELEDIYSRMQGVTAISYEPKISGAVNNNAPQDRLMPKYIEYQKELEKDINELIVLRKNAICLIDKLENADCIRVLYERYVMYKKWEEIAIGMNYAYRTVLRIHGQALKDFTEILAHNVTLKHGNIIE